MGITGQLARKEILDQAERRPAWAITLADLLLRKKRPAGVDQREGARLLTMAARSGLIDVLTGPLDGSRSHVVRSAMLADAPVAEQAFSAPVPGLDILGLAGQWPGHAAELTGAVITAAVLGAVNARHLARELPDEAIGDTEIPQQIKKSLCLEFMRLDRSAAEHATRIARQTLGQLDSADATAPLDAEGIVAIAGRGAWLYQLDTAVDPLLDMTLATRQPRHPRRGHPRPASGATRYKVDSTDTGSAGKGGAFTICSWWPGGHAGHDPVSQRIENEAGSDVFHPMNLMRSR
jgi:hypothetical protein